MGGRCSSRSCLLGVMLSLLVRFASHTEQLHHHLGIFFVMEKAPTSILRPAQDWR